MYSMVLVLSMTGAPEVPQFGWNKHGCSGGCYGSHAVATTGCYGCSGGCGGHGHGLFGGKLMNCFSHFRHKSHGCTGCQGGNGCVGGTMIVSPPVSGCGTVVIPPTTTVPPSTTVPPMTVPPPTTTPPSTIPPKTEPPKGTPKIG
jgi:hypothetical protein